MKNLLKKFMVCLVVLSMVATLAIALVACDKDKVEEKQITSADEIAKLFGDFVENQYSIMGYRLDIQEGMFDATYYVASQENRSCVEAITDNEGDYERAFYGKVYTDDTKAELSKTAGKYVMDDQTWSLEKAYDANVKWNEVISDIGIYEPVDYIEDIAKCLTDANVVKDLKVVATYKNDALVDYKISLKYDGKAFEIVLISTTLSSEKEGLVISSIKSDLFDAKYEYGKAVDVPVVE